MKADLIVIAQRRGDSTLRVLRVGLGHLALGKTEHATSGGKLHRRAQPGDSRANYDEIRLRRQWLGHESKSW